jgi:hypothetical protein
MKGAIDMSSPEDVERMAERLMIDFYVGPGYNPELARPADVVKAAIAFTLASLPAVSGRDEVLGVAERALTEIAASRRDDFSTLHPDSCASVAKSALDEILVLKSKSSPPSTNKAGTASRIGSGVALSVADAMHLQGTRPASTNEGERADVIECLAYLRQAYDGISADSFDGIEERYVVLLQEANSRAEQLLATLSSSPRGGEQP